MSRLGDAPGNSAGDTPAEASWSCEEIERLYREALDAVEAVANDLSSVTRTLSTDAESEADNENRRPAVTGVSRSPARQASVSTVPASPNHRRRSTKRAGPSRRRSSRRCCSSEANR